MFKKGDKAVVTFVGRPDMNQGIHIGDTVIIAEDNNPIPWCIRENGMKWPFNYYQLVLVEESKKEENAPKTETQPMTVNISISAELTHILTGGKRFRLVAED